MTHLRYIAVAVSLTFLGGPFAVAAPPAVASVLPPPLAMTYDFEGSTVTTDPSGHSRKQVMMMGHAVVQGDNVRIDINDAGSASEFMRQSFLLLLDNGHRTIWVNPIQRRYYEEAQFQSMATGLPALVNGSNGLIRMEASNIYISTQRMGDGPILYGYKTVHVRRTESMDMKTTVMSRTVKTHDESTTDYYYAQDLHVVNPFLASASDETSMNPLFNATYAFQLRQADEELLAVSHGNAPLRMVTNSKTTDELGSTLTTVTTMEVSNFNWLEVPMALFSVPPGYTKVASHLTLSGPSSVAPVLPREHPGGSVTVPTPSNIPSTHPKSDAKPSSNGPKINFSTDPSERTPISDPGYY